MRQPHAANASSPIDGARGEDDDDRAPRPIAAEDCTQPVG